MKNIGTIVIITCILLISGNISSIIADVDVSDMTENSENKDIVDKPDEDCEATEGEKGGLATLILIYTKIRNAVRTAYDEIQYWKGIKRTYQEVKKWFKNQKKYLKHVRNIATEIFSQKDDIFTKLEKAEDLFDITDYMIFHETRKFDDLIAKAEYYADRSVIMPPTEQIIDVINELFESSSKVKDPNQLQSQAEKKYHENKKTLKELQLAYYPEYKIVKAAKIISSSAIANSEATFQWCVNTLDHYNRIDNMTKDMDNVNELNMSAAWFAMEQVNANNKKIRHSNQETKTLLAILGFDLWEMSKQRSREILVDEHYLKLERDLIGECYIVKDNIRNYGTYGTGFIDNYN